MFNRPQRGSLDVIDGAGLDVFGAWDAVVCDGSRDGGNMQIYTLMIDMPWRPVSTTVRALDDRQAAATAAEMVSSTCTQIDGLGEYRTRLTRADGSDVFEPVSVAALIAKA